MELARSVGKVFFPLDKELGLTRSDLTPRAQEGLVRLATWLPYEKAAQVLESLIGVHASKASARRTTLQAGRFLKQELDQQANQLQATPQAAPVGPERLVVSADGAMVPLVGGIWAEVKTLVIGTVTVPKEGESTRVHDLSYCSRLTDVPGFEQASLVEVHRRGLEHAEKVAAVMDERTGCKG